MSSNDLVPPAKSAPAPARSAATPVMSAPVPAKPAAAEVEFARGGPWQRPKLSAGRGGEGCGFTPPAVCPRTIQSF